MKMFSSFSILFLICNLFIYLKAEISDLRACADPQCQDLISKGRTVQRYLPKEEGVLSFNADEVVSIYSKEAGSNEELWGGEIKGKRGYIPKRFVREEKVYIKEKLKYLVPTDNKSSSKLEKTNSDLSQESTTFKSSDIKAEIIADSANTNSDPSSQNKFLDEVLLSSEDAEFAALEKLSVKGEKETLKSPVNSKTHTKEIETLDDGERSQIPLSNEIESLASTDNKEGSQASIDKTESQDPVSIKEGYDVPIDNIMESIALDKNKMEFQNNKAESLFPNDDMKSQAPIDLKEKSQPPIEEGLHVPSSNKEPLTNKIEPSEEKKENGNQNVNLLEDKEKPNLELLNKGNKIEEEMGNNEGNGNEGEDNGSEYMGDVSHEINKEEPVDSNSIQPIPIDITESPLLKEGTAKFKQESSNFVTSESVTDVKLSESFPKESKTVNDKSSVHKIPEPTPSKIQVVDGTTLFWDESDSDPSSAISEPEDTHSDLESSSDRKVIPNIENTTPTPHLPDGSLLTQPPLIMQNLKLTTESTTQKYSETFTPPVDAAKILHQDENVPESYSQSENDVESSDTNKVSPSILQENKVDVNGVEFSTLKPETMLENNGEDATNINEGPVENTDNIHSDKGENDENDQIESFSILEGELKNDISKPDDPVNMYDSPQNPDEKYEDSQNQKNDESLDSVQEETTVPSILTSTDDEKEESMLSGKGFLSSISNIFGYHDSESAEESKEMEPENEMKEEYSEESKSELELSELKDSVSDNTTASDITMNNIPFIDPLPKPEEEFTKDIHSVDEKSSDLSHSDDSELGFSSSIKKKLLHVSEAVFKWIFGVIKFSEGLALAVEGELADPHLSKGTVTFLLVVAATIVVLYISHMCFVKWSRESPLLGSLNQLERNHRIVAEENKNLKRQLTDSNGQIKSALVTDPVALKNIKQQFEEAQKRLMDEAEDLRERNQQLEADLEASTTNEVELHRMLNELLANQKETTNFEDSVNGLQSMLDSQREVVENLTSDLALKTRLNEELRNELKDGKMKVSKLEYQIEQLTQSLEEVKILKKELTEKLASEEENSISLREMNNTLREEANKASLESEARYQETQKLLKDIRKLKQSLHSKETECQISKECLKKLQIFSDSGNDVLNKLSEVFKIIEVKTQLESIQYERSSIQTQLEEKENILSSLSEDLKRFENENTSLKSSSEWLQKERDEAVSKLEVLSRYYEEKETQLKKALESQEDLLQNAEGSANLISNRIHTYEIELASCKSQIESLKNELEEQKQSYKIQLSNEEKKLHETWLSARAAERRQEELRQENTQLRQSLTHLQREADSKIMFNKPPPKRVDANGSISSPIPVENDINTSLPPGIHPPLDMDGPMPPHLPPPHMMFPPPPGLPPLPPRMFGPPLHPPHHPPMPDRRLPPAGRIASPPGYDRRSYSPESDRSRYSDHRYSPGPPSAFSSNNQRGPSPDRRSDNMRRNIRRGAHRSPSLERTSPRERWYNQSPTGVPPKNHRTPPLDYYDSPPTQERRRVNLNKGKKTSTPIGLNDR